MAEHNEIGNIGEQIAQNFLSKKGYEILDVNWRYRKAEIDIICQWEKTLVIVEVKTRTSKFFENPKEAVTIPKQRLIIRAANAYIEENNIKYECRFDIVSVLLLNNKKEIEHIEDAFYPLI